MAVTLFVYLGFWTGYGQVERWDTSGAQELRRALDNCKSAGEETQLDYVCKVSKKP